MVVQRWWQFCDIFVLLTSQCVCFDLLGATEIDLIEVMGGDSNGPLKGTDPPVALPYGTMTLQVRF